MSQFTKIQVPYVPDWASDIISYRINSNLTDGESCFGVVRRKASPIEQKEEQQHFQWITSKPWRATKCPIWQHRSAECRCSERICTCKHRCRCRDGERIACRRVKKPRKLTLLKEMEVYSELEPCEHCERYFRALSAKENMRVTCFWSAKNKQELSQLFRLTANMWELGFIPTDWDSTGSWRFGRTLVSFARLWFGSALWLTGR